jgi:expansin (peptidoglycan-binding protein)
MLAGLSLGSVLTLVGLALAGCGGPADEESSPQDVETFGNRPNGANAGGSGGGSAVGVSNGVPAASQCITGQSRCNGGRTVETCNAAGNGFDAQSCQGTMVCLAGACRQPMCTPGETLCLGNEIHTCNTDGRSTALSRTCDSGSACDPAMLACRQTLCEPLLATCDSNRATRCDPTGFAYNAGDVRECGTGLLCNRGSCVNPESIMPGAPLSPGMTPITPAPGVINPMQAGPNLPAPPTPTCTAGQVLCDGANTIATCAADGLGVSITRCPSGTVCGGAGACNPVTCNTQSLTNFNNGQATVYWFAQGTVNNGNVACNFGIRPGNPGNGQGDAVNGLPNPELFIAMNTTNYRGASACGACVEMTYQGRNVTATVADECPIGSNPTCTPGHLDLSRGAWNALTNNAAGTEINGVNWRFVPCAGEANVTIELKEPENLYWNQFLVRGHRFPVAKAEVELANGTWVEAARQGYNYFEPPEGVMGTYRVRVTDVNGGIIEEQLELAAGPQGGNAQFACQ